MSNIEIKIAGDVVNVASDPRIELAQCIIADPPYFIDVKTTAGKAMDWDKANAKQSELVDWYIQWTKLYADKLKDGGAFYIWGGIGKPGMRVFFEFASRVEQETGLTLQAMITWHKRRAYGTANNYLFTREELMFLSKGKPSVFNIPYLEKERGYEGFNKKYPAKSKYLRRSMVWDDVTEIFKGKTHIAHKPERLSEIMIETSSNPGDWIIDLFSGSGSTRKAATKLNRNVVSIELDPSLLT